MKSYRSAREVCADVQRTLADAKPSFHKTTPLHKVAKILQEGRHYAWVAVSVEVGVPSAAQASCGAAGTGAAEIDVPIQLVQRVLGTLSVRSARPFSSDERVLLKSVARRLALFLTGKGKYLVRKAREAARAESEREEKRGYQPSSEKMMVGGRRTAVVGDKS